MSEEHEDEPEPLVIEITADTTKAVESLWQAQGAMMFAFHPDLRSTGPVGPDEEPTT